MALLFRCYFCGRPSSDPYVASLANDDDILFDQTCIGKAELIGGKSIGQVTGAIQITQPTTTN